MESNHIHVRPVTPAAPYIGGKRALSAKICAMIDAVPHRAYVEPFVGMGGVFLRRHRRPPVEVVNDISEDVSTFFRILQRHYVAFMDMLRFQLTTRSGFERLVQVKPETLTDLERAARFLYLQRLAFGGKVKGRSFGVTTDTPARFDVTKLGPILEDLHERLAGVTIERLPFNEVIDRYDTPATLFYLDPPYWGCETDYGPDVFQQDDFARLADQLDRIDGRFILSINATDGAREVFDRFDVEEVELVYSIGNLAIGEGKRVKELIVKTRGLQTAAPTLFEGCAVR
jgi:DNA adenine methylase